MGIALLTDKQMDAVTSLSFAYFWQLQSSALNYIRSGTPFCYN
jgi:hypothetical protein